MANISLVTHNIRLVKNDDWNYNITVVDASGNPFDFTGWTGKAEMRKTETSANVILTFQTPTTMVLTAGNINLNAPKANTGMNSGAYVYDIEFVDDAGESRTLIKGVFTVVEDITQ